MNEYDEMEECAELLRQVQNRLERIPSKDKIWNKHMRDEIDEWCSILSI